MAFDKPTRNRLASFVSEARDLVSAEFTQQFQSIYGISDKGTVTDLDELKHLDDAGLSTATLLRERIDYLVRTHPGEKDAKKAAVERLAREQAFTILNRLAALRMAEKRGLIVESVGKGYQSQGFKVFEQVAGSGLGETFQRYRRYLFCLFDELAVDLGVLFHRSSPQGLLFPREPALLELLELLNAADLDSLWAEDETIGWIYQYYNDPAERKKMREAGAPRNSRELAVRNQFFTPRYVVEFLTDNTLGRIWYEMTQGETRLKEQCRYLVRRPTEIFLKPNEAARELLSQDSLSQEELLKQPVYVPYRPLKDPREIRMLDPACGSMHFGLYAFDLFEVIYEEAWDRGLESLRRDFPEKEMLLREAPRLIIEHNIHGIDIDPRCAQIAGLSLWLRAHRCWQSQKLAPARRPRIQKSNIVCAEPMPGDKTMLREFVQNQFSTSEQPVFSRLLETIFDKMKLAGEAGSLLKIEEEIRSAVDEARKLWEKTQTKPRELFSTEEINRTLRPGAQPNLAGLEQAVSQMPKDFWGTVEDQIYTALRDYAEQAENGGGYQRRLFAEDAAQGFAFIDVCRKRYDVVEMNPPFGEAVKSTDAYIADEYEYSSADIFHAFVERGLIWLNPDAREGVISARTGFFLGNSKDWRKNVVFQNRLACFADLGLGVLDDALVEVAAYAIERGQPVGSRVFTNRQLDTREKEIGLLSAIQATANGGAGGLGLFDQSLLEIIPDHTFAYWAPADLLKRYAEPARFGNVVGRVRQGVATADDFRFARLGWEVANEFIGSNKRWQRFSKGGEYSPPYDDIHLLVDWGKDGAQLKAFEGCFIRNDAFYFKPGATYTVRTASAFTGKVLPAGCIFSHNAQSWFTDSTDLTLLSIGYLCCRVPQTFLELAVGSGDIATAGSAARRYTTAVVESVPAGVMQMLKTPTNLELIKSLYRFRLSEFTADESSCHFCNFHITNSGLGLRQAAARRQRAFVSAAVQALTQSGQLDEKVTSAFALAEDEVAFVNQEVGLHPTAYTSAVSDTEVTRLFNLDEEALIAEAVSRHGSKRWFTKKSYFVDRRLEIICHMLSISPSTLQSLLGEQAISVGLEDFASSVTSEAVGFTVGRWDIRYATGAKAAPEWHDPFAPLPVCPPGMLQNGNGLPANPKDVPADYPLRISWGGILVDDENHPEDIVARVEDVLKVIWKDRWEAIEHEACELLGVKNLRDYFHRPGGFFADHLQRYSKSRRQAPIYWPLSTASGSYTIWLYYHRLNENTLHTALADFVDPKLRSVRTEISALRESGARRDRLEGLLDLEKELEDFRAEIERIIKLPWKPNLNDGVLITASPLWKLFRLPKWQKDLKACWDELAKGDYDWAHLAYTIWPNRVKEVCKTDHSIAIAHGLDHLCEVKAPKAKAKRQKQISAKFDDLEA